MTFPCRKSRLPSLKLQARYFFAVIKPERAPPHPVRDDGVFFCPEGVGLCSIYIRGALIPSE